LHGRSKDARVQWLAAAATKRLVVLRPYRRLTIAHVGNILAAVAVGLITGFWLRAEAVAVIWGLYAVVMVLLGAARRCSDR
jgi:hypothetical protein